MTTAKKKPTPTAKATAQASPEPPVAEKAQKPETQEDLPQVQIEGEKDPAPEVQESQPEAVPEAQGDQPEVAPDEKLSGKVAVLKVTARGDSFRRANLQFGSKERLLFVEDLSPAQLTAIRNEPRLIVVADVIDAEE